MKYNLDLTDSIAILSALIALFIGYVTIRLSIIASINSQLSEKAKECNKYLSPDTLMASNKNADGSAIVSSIEFAKKLINLNYDIYWLALIGFDEQRFIDMFYLQLHTSIIEFIKNENFDPVDFDVNTTPQIRQQLSFCKMWLRISIDKFGV